MTAPILVLGIGTRLKGQSLLEAPVQPGDVWPADMIWPNLPMPGNAGGGRGEVLHGRTEALQSPSPREATTGPALFFASTAPSLRLSAVQTFLGSWGGGGRRGGGWGIGGGRVRESRRVGRVSDTSATMWSDPEISGGANSSALPLIVIGQSRPEQNAHFHHRVQYEGRLGFLQCQLNISHDKLTSAPRPDVTTLRQSIRDTDNVREDLFFITSTSG